MIPLKLTIEGLYSYREKQTIDFTKLTPAGLFGIFGGVGSGKSSILEAISFAIYGDTERLNSRDKRSYNMMNLKSSSLLIDFEFKGNDQAIYRFVVKSKRNGKKFEDAGKFERSAFKKEKIDWIPIDYKEIETITGLNYTNFKRTIIIPQGRFQEFLQLKETERVLMLKELFNLQKYDLSHKVKLVDEKNNISLNQIIGQMEAIGEIDSSEIKNKKNQLKELAETIRLKKEEFNIKQQQHQELQKLKQLTESIRLEKNKLNLLEASKNEIAALEKEIKEYESFRLTFQSDFDRLDKLNQSILYKSNEIKNSEKLKTELKSQEQDFIKQIAKIKPDYDSHPKLAKEAEELDKLAEKKILEEKSIKKMENLTKERAKLKDLEADLVNTKSKIAKLTNEISKNKKQLPDIQELNDIKTWFTRKDQIQTAISSAREQHTKTFDRICQLQKEASNLYNASGLFSEKVELENLVVLMQETNKLIDSQEKAKEEKSTEITNLTVQYELEKFAKDLEEGSACPLCGSVHHPQPLNAGDVIDQLHLLKTNLEVIEANIKKARKLEIDFIRIQRDLENTENQLKTDEKTINQGEKNATNHFKSFKWTNFDSDNLAALHASFEHYQSINKIIANKEAELAGKNQLLEKKQVEKEKVALLLSNLETELNTFDSQQKLLAAQIQMIDVSIYESTTVEQLKIRASQKSKQQKEIIEKFENTSKLLQEVKTQLSALSGKLEEAIKTFESLQGEKSALNKTIAKKLLQVDGLHVNTIRTVLKKNIQVEEGKEKIAQYKEKLSEVKGLISGWEKELNNRTYIEQEHQVLITELSHLSESIEKGTTAIGVLTKEIDQLEKAAEQFKSLKVKYEKLQLRHEDIKELKRLFSGKGFVNFVSTVHLQNLCLAANDRLLKLTRQQLGLEINEENEIIIRDYMNEGKWRSVKTLSGGQTFQASLSLALSLADSIHRMSGTTENFFFLDEGFGSLDNDSLAVVFESLKALRKENRIVGFISHVEEMQQQIETFIHVVNDEERGSLVKGSWEL